MYLPKHHLSHTTTISEDEMIRELKIRLGELECKVQDTISNTSAVTKEIEVVAKFVADYWNTRADGKQLAVDKLVRIIRRLNQLS